MTLGVTTRLVREPTPAPPKLVRPTHGAAETAQR
jgi:hypothetical protein